MAARKPAGPAFDLLPAIDLRGGRVVRLLRGDFGAETAYGDDPVAVAARFVEAGAAWLHVVDLDGARDPGRRQIDLLAAIVGGVGDRARVEVAGGLRDKASVEAILAAGAARVVVGTAALSDPAFARELVAVLGTSRVAVALDVRDGLAVGHGWRAGAAGVPVEDALRRLADAGVSTFEVTAIDRDGTLGGPDVELLARLVALGRGDVIASAGISSLEDLRVVRDLGSAGAIVGRALYEGTLDLRAALAQTQGDGDGRGRAATTREDFFAGHPAAWAVFERVRAILQGFGPLEIRTSRSQVAFRRRRGFAFLWLPGRYLRRPAASLVLSIALGRRDASPRFKEVVHPARAHWLHHLEIHDPGDVDGEVVDWLLEAADQAG